MPKPPLAGVRVLTMAEQLPGPYATMLLADLGADVILVERPKGGDPSRRFPGLFTSLNRNKRSVTIDLKLPEERERFMKLVDSADAFLEGFRPGTVKRLGIDAESLRRRKPGLIYVSISSFGQDGPWVNIAGHDLSIQAAAGMMQVPIGEESRRDVPMLPMADIASGVFAAFGVVAALYGREKNGNGATLDVSMLDSLVSWMTCILGPPLNNLPLRDLPPLDPGYGIYSTKDRKQITLSIAGEDPMWAELCDLLGLKDLANLNEADRSALVAEIDPLVRDAMRQWDHDPLVVELEKRKIAFGPVLGITEALHGPQLEHRRMVQEFSNAGRKQRYVMQPILFDGEQFQLRRGVPQLGQDNKDVLGR
jgi:crotonobetainyl-CoA:carnitine CoA-transferase CaiB-like acyl-CoA transferase